MGAQKPAQGPEDRPAAGSNSAPTMSPSRARMVLVGMIAFFAGSMYLVTLMTESEGIPLLAFLLAAASGLALSVVGTAYLIRRARQKAEGSQQSGSAKPQYAVIAAGSVGGMLLAKTLSGPSVPLVLFFGLALVIGTLGYVLYYSWRNPRTEP